MRTLGHARVIAHARNWLRQLDEHATGLREMAVRVEEDRALSGDGRLLVDDARALAEAIQSSAERVRFLVGDPRDTSSRSTNSAEEREEGIQWTSRGT